MANSDDDVIDLTLLDTPPGSRPSSPPPSTAVQVAAAAARAATTLGSDSDVEFLTPEQARAETLQRQKRKSAGSSPPSKAGACLQPHSAAAAVPAATAATPAPSSHAQLQADCRSPFAPAAEQQAVQGGGGTDPNSSAPSSLQPAKKQRLLNGSEAAEAVPPQDVQPPQAGLRPGEDTSAPQQLLKRQSSDSLQSSGAAVQAEPAASQPRHVADMHSDASQGDSSISIGGEAAVSAFQAAAGAAAQISASVGTQGQQVRQQPAPEAAAPSAAPPQPVISAPPAGQAAAAAAQAAAAPAPAPAPPVQVKEEPDVQMPSQQQPVHWQQQRQQQSRPHSEAERPTSEDGQPSPKVLKVSPSFSKDRLAGQQQGDLHQAAPPAAPRPPGDADAVGSNSGATTAPLTAPGSEAEGNSSVDQASPDKSPLERQLPAAMPRTPSPQAVPPPAAPASEQQSAELPPHLAPPQHHQAVGGSTQSEHTAVQSTSAAPLPAQAADSQGVAAPAQKRALFVPPAAMRRRLPGSGDPTSSGPAGPATAMPEGEPAAAVSAPVASTPAGAAAAPGGEAGAQAASGLAPPAPAAEAADPGDGGSPAAAPSEAQQPERQPAAASPSAAETASEPLPLRRGSSREDRFERMFEEAAALGATRQGRRTAAVAASLQIADGAAAEQQRRQRRRREPAAPRTQRPGREAAAAAQPASPVAGAGTAAQARPQASVEAQRRQRAGSNAEAGSSGTAAAAAAGGSDQPSRQPRRHAAGDVKYLATMLGPPWTAKLVWKLQHSKTEVKKRDALALADASQADRKKLYSSEWRQQRAERTLQDMGTSAVTVQQVRAAVRQLRKIPPQAAVDADRDGTAAQAAAPAAAVAGAAAVAQHASGPTAATGAQLAAPAAGAARAASSTGHAAPVPSDGAATPQAEAAGRMGTAAAAGTAATPAAAATVDAAGSAAAPAPVQPAAAAAPPAAVGAASPGAAAPGGPERWRGMPEAAAVGPIFEAGPGPLALDLPREYVVDPAAVETKDADLQAYRERFEFIRIHGKNGSNAKPDMQANKFDDIGGRLRPAPLPGHIPGVAIGERFRNKGELCILGIHPKIGAGIYYAKGQPAYSIVNTGGYAGNNDAGTSFVYSGQGQRGDQTWTNAANTALRRSCLENMPVRVCRRLSRDDPTVAYEGMYRVTRCWQGPEVVEVKKPTEGAEQQAAEKQEPPRAPRIICLFRFEAIPGHSTVSAKVVNRRARVAQPRRLLATAAPTERRAAATAADEKRRAAAQANLEEHRGKCVCADIAGGLEHKPIPVYNDVDDEVSPTDRMDAQRLTYIKDLVPKAGSRAAEFLDNGQKALEAAYADGRPRCGLRLMGEAPYVKSRLAWTECAGVYECPASCTGEACALNRVVTAGIKVPLEVFKTPNRGWGLRCIKNLYAGEFICSYVGLVITDEEAEDPAFTTNDCYLMNLEHYVNLYEDLETEAARGCAYEWKSSWMPPLPFGARPSQVDADSHPQHCCIDASTTGNVARFMNHSCVPNCAKQTVITEGDHGLCYRIAFFADQTILAGEELTYAYGWVHRELEDRHMRCLCGAPSCIGDLFTGE